MHVELGGLHCIDLMYLQYVFLLYLFNTIMRMYVELWGPWYVDTIYYWIWILFVQYLYYCIYLFVHVELCEVYSDLHTSTSIHTVPLTIMWMKMQGELVVLQRLIYIPLCTSEYPVSYIKCMLNFHVCRDLIYVLLWNVLKPRNSFTLKLACMDELMRIKFVLLCGGP